MKYQSAAGLARRTRMASASTGLSGGTAEDVTAYASMAARNTPSANATPVATVKTRASRRFLDRLGNSLAKNHTSAA